MGEGERTELLATHEAGRRALFAAIVCAALPLVILGILALTRIACEMLTAVVLHGPQRYFGLPAFDVGTLKIAETVAISPGNSEALSAVAEPWRGDA
jgi:hypothetical protein